MTDRELLEMAAKAAGYKVNLLDDNPEYWYRWDTKWKESWNPLTDDGDAFRLAVKLKMAILIGSYGFKGETSWARCGMLSREDYHNDDPYAGTRRAIVRVAAEIGKDMG